MKLIDGKQTAQDLKKDIAVEVADFIRQYGRRPHLAAVLVGEDPASQTYVRNKEKDCKEVGMDSSLYKFPDTITREELISCVQTINDDPEIDGLIVQLPLPDHLDAQEIIETIDPSKDVDGFHPVNVGRMVLGLPSFVSATPAGIADLLEYYKIPTQGKECVIIGRSNIVGKPLANLLSQKGPGGDCTVTLCHSRTKELDKICRRADILIAALGRPGFLKANMVKEGAVVIDVGISRVEDKNTKSGFRLAGDVDFEQVAPRCSYITPVPGGVGPMTRVSLLKNTLKAALKHIK
ncbi:MAG: bifunctional methylenetetrahydrofolate dehydrogenase/methenyltetrahydrofolate cyclohydrolase FolD [Bacteroidales bacterium]|jgi:methylenetetrahydrofolate dehydrogenase (NADP+)/methenyltetrahydrofolate cyclohydrolase|nr:bifunctional methylenetetrahydrofolate dehydrogenase/methenyltetrahydrofolate cyclohydrolase FolD [Bacteroidales bacterium]MDD2770913.1 bifunctional methylenetetrahydrofolate dehydrogenase/methenyltetrahydrofolate cyclohydrolase FolD [Bacteroidales bacterium]MDD3104769.1 bifunctional methylenetetrahydrofolate dehydrogenase/methenyltetrahydrofolate cyclohydrolase FolD [Bacteroidales bacterium]MDD3549618.1 bifunctional methylenetetrahydrofolate dehydrogenase/methenyltetrahydrofolate cyclohydrol